MPTDCTSFKSSVYTLVFSGDTLGTHIHDWKTTSRRMSEIAERQNFWASDVILDGRYPALVYEHVFTLYTESTDEVDYAHDVLLLNAKIEGDPRALNILCKTNTVVCFGNCYMTPPEQNDPDSFLLSAAGLISLRFLGTQLPSIG